MGRGEASALFGKPNGEGLSAILKSISQTFGGVPLYSCAEEQAATLLYFLVKDHPFLYENKRIGVLLFAKTLEPNDMHINKQGKEKI